MRCYDKILVNVAAYVIPGYVWVCVGGWVRSKNPCLLRNTHTHTHTHT